MLHTQYKLTWSIFFTMAEGITTLEQLCNHHIIVVTLHYGHVLLEILRFDCGFYVWAAGHSAKSQHHFFVL